MANETDRKRGEWYLFPPRAQYGETKFTVRGTFLGIKLDRLSTGCDKPEAAQKVLDQWKRDAILGAFRTPQQKREEAKQKAAKAGKVKTFSACADEYIATGRSGRFMEPNSRLRKALGAVAITELTQELVNKIARELYPNGAAGTQNRQVFTPVNAVLGYNKLARLTRPEGYTPEKSEYFYSYDEVFAVMETAYEANLELAVFLELLFYTGMRRGEALKIKLHWLNLRTATLTLPPRTVVNGSKKRVTKNGRERVVHLTPDCVKALRKLNLDRPADQPLFCGIVLGSVYRQLHAIQQKAAEKVATILRFPEGRRGFHTLRHSFATWYCRENKCGPQQLVDMGAWDSVACASLYWHPDASDAAQKANNIRSRSQTEPTPPANVVPFPATSGDQVGAERAA